jgi:hypothetical protein
MSKVARCERCKYFKSSVYTGHSNPDFGHCMFNPPVVLMDPKLGDIKSKRPTVNKYDWCGHWEADNGA